MSHGLTPARTDGPWTIGPEPARPRYLVLGEEGGENLAIYGHGVDEDSIRAAINHAGFGRILEDLVVDGTTLAAGPAVADLPQFETWAREMHGCPRHRWLPRWLRVGVVGAVDWARWQVFRMVWRLWRSRNPLRRRHVPKWLSWLGNRWRLFAGCPTCEYVDHYRTCSGCGFCASDGTGTAPPWWDWSTKPGEPADANRGKPGYSPVTIIDLNG